MVLKDGPTDPELIKEALDRINANVANRVANSEADIMLVITCGQVIGLRRVEGDDSEPNQVIRRLMGDPVQRDAIPPVVWDVYQIHKEGVISYSCRCLGPMKDPPRDLTIDWQESFQQCY